MKKYHGLTDEEVKLSREKNGTNEIVEKEPETFWDKCKETLNDPMLKLLMGIAVIFGIMSFFGYADIYEVIGIIVAIIIVTCVSAKTEVSNDKNYRDLKASTDKPKTKVIRNGEVLEVLFDEVVVGDYVLIQAGDKVPADGVLIDGSLKVDNSALNGEAEECKKKAVPENFNYENEFDENGDKKINFTDNYSLYRGAVIFDGEGILEIKEVGMNTMSGKMAEDMNVDDVESPLKVKLSKLADQISKFGYIGAICIAIALLVNEVIQIGGISAYINLGMVMILKDVLDAVAVASTIIVMAVPEGLPLMIAIVLMRNTSKMLKDNVLVRKAIGIETAGSLNILFSDKTGTITKGELQVSSFFDGNGEDTYKTSSIIKEYIDKCIGKNTGAMFDDKGIVIGGNATDKALLKFLTKEEFNKYSNVEVLKTQLFNSSNKYSSAQLENITVYKGAPEKLLSKATKYLDINGQVVDIDKEKINAKIDELAKRAMRVLSFAYSTSPLVEDTLPNDLIMVGFVGIRDDVRDEAKEAILEVQNAGIQVVMITGDRKETAMAIAKEAGLFDESKGHISLTSDELKAKSDDEIKEILPNIRVIARALPTDKSRMVRLSQELNLVCGMTGDGVNDSPALKRADVGFAMGSGTDVAKEASDIVILDNNFNSIRKSILYGRTIYNNIRKFIKFQLLINVSAVGISAIAPFIGIIHPLGIVHMLWINLIMDGLAALALGSEPALEKYMKEKPKSRTENIISKEMMTSIISGSIWVIALSLLYFKLPIIRELFVTDEAFTTGYFCFFVFTAVFNGLNVKSAGIDVFSHFNENEDFIKVMSIIAVVQVAVTYIGGELFKCTPLNLIEWAIILVMAISIIPYDLLRKLIMNSK